MSDTNGLAELRDELEQRRHHLEADLIRLTAPPLESAAVAFGKRVGDGTTEAVERISTTAAARSITASIKDIDRAIAKIDHGSYGRCDTCDKAIPVERLLALPSTSHCVDCATPR